MDPIDQLRKENEYLAEALARIEARLPSDEDLEFLKQRRIEAERVAWMWQAFRRHAPWVVTAAGLVGTGIAWLASNSINITTKH